MKHQRRGIKEKALKKRHQRRGIKEEALRRKKRRQEASKTTRHIKEEGRHP